METGKHQSLIDSAKEMGMLVGIISRKKEGTDCTEAESAEIKGYIRDNPHTMLAKELIELFPQEAGEVQDETLNP